MNELIIPLTPRVTPCVIQSSLPFNSMDRTLKCDHSLGSCRAVLYCGAVFRFYPVCNFGKRISFGLGTVSSERVNNWFSENHKHSPNNHAFLCEILDY